jgi:hypothetical protein
VKAILFALFVWTLAPTAHAAGNVMEPRVRAHAGGFVTQGPAGIGVTGGLESRLSRMIYVDLGALYNPVNITTANDLDGTTTAEPFLLRHVLYLTPGLRIPHRQPEGFRWDVNFRVGPGVLWSAYVGDSLNPEKILDEMEADVALITGADLGVLVGKYGVRLSGRFVAARPYHKGTQLETRFYAPVGLLEGFYQF